MLSVNERQKEISVPSINFYENALTLRLHKTFCSNIMCQSKLHSRASVLSKMLPFDFAAFDWMSNFYYEMTAEVETTTQREREG